MRRERILLTLSERQNHRCCYCGHPMVRHQHRDGIPTPRNAMTRDHVEPRSLGGCYDDNIVIACAQCNQLRGNMDAVAFANLTSKWFRRDHHLRIRWHHLSHHTLRELKVICLRTQERQLLGLAHRSIRWGFEHHRWFISDQWNQRLLRAA